MDSLMRFLRGIINPGELISPIPKPNTMGDYHNMKLSYGAGSPQPILPSNNVTPRIGSNVPAVSPLAKFLHDKQGRLNQPIPEGTGAATQFIQSQTPGNQNINSYYPALHDSSFMQKISSADQTRPGLSNLLLLQPFFESTLGRGGNALYGAKPGGQAANFASPSDALDYQLSPSVMGGGANPNMNILSSNKPLTYGDIVNFYKSYDPPGAYLPSLLTGLGM